MGERDVGTVDVVVIGSGMAGVCAAIQAGRLGCSVALLEEDSVLGGNSSPNLGIHISGAHSFHPYAGETGIINEIEEVAAHYHAKSLSHTYHYSIAMQWHTVLRRMLEEAGVAVYLRTFGKTVEMDGHRIRSVVAEDIALRQTCRFGVGVAAIDASGDGQIARSAGAEFRMGREAQSEFGERGAPEVADDITMGTSVTALVRKTDHPVTFVPPPGTPPFEVGYGYHRTAVSRDCVHAHSCWDPRAEFCFLWHTETGGEVDTIADDHEICARLHGHLYAAWNHIKNEAHQKEAECWELVWVSPKAGKRESRRFVGDVLLTQTDVETARAFDDVVGYGGYAVDVHDPVGEQARVIFHSIPPLYSIPYRCLYSRNVENLLLAGRHVSVTHMALGTVRLQKTLGTLGQAAGAAAWLCKVRGATPRGVYASHLDELQQLLLRHDATVMGVTNADAGDLARDAEVSATSEARFACTSYEDFVPLDRTRGVMLWDWGSRLHEVQLYLMNQGDVPQDVSLALAFYGRDQKWRESARPVMPMHLAGQANRMEWGGDCTVSRFENRVEAKATIPPKYVGWVAFGLGDGVDLAEVDATSDEQRYAFTLAPAEGVSWARHRGFEDFAVACWANPGDETYTTAPELYLFQLGPRPRYGEAANVVGGTARRLSTNPVNMWISERGSPLPQILTLDFGRVRGFGRAHVTFDTMYRAYREMPFNHEERDAAGMCVRDYDLEVWDGGKWRTVASEKGNYRRFRVHTFSRVESEKLRLVVRATQEPGWEARVYEVRVYDGGEELGMPPATADAETQGAPADQRNGQVELPGVDSGKATGEGAMNVFAV